MNKLLIFLLTLTWLFAGPAKAHTYWWVASYYGAYFHGRTTANGETYNMWADTCAHKSLRFGTRLRLTNPHTGKVAVCRINDRGPYIAGRTLDVSKGVAQKLGMLSAGVVTLKVEVLQ